MLWRRAFKSLFNGSLAEKLSRRLFRQRTVCRLLAKIAQMRPVDRRKVVFASLAGGFSCNPKYIALELTRRRSDIDIVWLVDSLGRSTDLPTGMRSVPLWSWRAIREMATARHLWRMRRKCFCLMLCESARGSCI